MMLHLDNSQLSEALKELNLIHYPSKLFKLLDLKQVISKLEIKLVLFHLLTTTQLTSHLSSRLLLHEEVFKLLFKLIRIDKIIKF